MNEFFLLLYKFTDERNPCQIFKKAPKNAKRMGSDNCLWSLLAAAALEDLTELFLIN